MNVLKSIEGERITDYQGRTSWVFEVLPVDNEQLTPEEFTAWQRSLRSWLNQLPVPEAKVVSGVQRILGMKEEEGQWYKLYSLGEEIFINTSHESLAIPQCKLKESAVAFNSLIGAEDFYSDVAVKEDYLHFNSIYFRMINLYEMPRNLHAFELQDLGDLVVCFKKVNPDAAKRRINTQRKLHHANLYKGMRNLESEASYTEAEAMTEALMVGDVAMFEVEAWFLVRSSSLEELNSKTQGLISQLKQREITFLIESAGLTDLFPTILFGMAPDFKRSHECPSSYLAELLPLKKDSLMDDGLKFTSQRGSPVHFSLFNPESLNFNALFTGVSGAGKSMGAQKVVNEEIARGAKAVILDLGNSFDKLARFHNANIFSQKFNPLQFRDVKYLKEFVISVIPEAELSAKLEGKIFKVIQESLDKVDSFAALIERLEQEIPDVSLYFSELWEFFTDKEVSLTNLTYVNTTDFPDKIKAPLIIYLIEYFKRLEGKKIFVFDEVWSFLRKNAGYIEESFRTFRKENASALAISQALSDFTSTEIGRVIADLSYYKFLFQQNIEGVSSLTDFDHSRIKTLQSIKGQYSEFYLKSENIRKVLRFYPNALEYVLFNTEPAEKIELAKFQAIYGSFFSFDNVIERFVDFKYHNKGAMNA